MLGARTAATTAAIALTLTATAAPAWAHTTVIATLGTSPLLGYNAGRAALRTHVNEKSGLFDDAGAALGLSLAQRRELRFRINADHLTAVTVPRHLDAMTWAASGRVRVLRDVQIPAGTQGWETDLVEGGQVVALFIPAKCGNLSVIRRAAPRVAAAHEVAPAAVAAAAAPLPTAAAPVAAEAPAAVPPAAPVDIAAVPAPPPAPRGYHLSPFAAIIPALLGFRSGSSNAAPAITTTVYPGSGTTSTPGTTTPPAVTPPATPPAPPPGVGTVPCGPNPCK